MNSLDPVKAAEWIERNLESSETVLHLATVEKLIGLLEVKIGSERVEGLRWGFEVKAASMNYRKCKTEKLIQQ